MRRDEARRCCRRLGVESGEGVSPSSVGEGLSPPQKKNCTFDSEMTTFFVYSDQIFEAWI